MARNWQLMARAWPCFFVAFQDLVTRDLLDCLDISADLHVLFRLHIYY